MTIDRPRLAALNSPASASAIVQATAHYEAERRVVDPRLFQRVTVTMPRGDIGELLDLLRRQTGVALAVTQDREDLKLTVLAPNVPVRDLMAQLAELFNLEWRRYDGSGGYRYELSQAVSERLKEEGLRRQDEDQMLLDAIGRLEPYLAYLDESKERLLSMAGELRRQAAAARDDGERASLVSRAVGLMKIANIEEARDGLAVFAGLTPGQLVALRNGEVVTVSSAGAEPGMPHDIAERRASAVRDRLAAEDRPVEGITVADIEVSVRFSLQPIGLDRRDLMVEWRERLVKPGSDPYASDYPPIPLASGQPERLRQPGNEAEHAALLTAPEFRVRIRLDPRRAAGLPSISEAASRGLAGTQEWIDSADLFAELQRKTGRAILADYYTHVYPASAFRTDGAPLLDVLNRAADILKSGWQAEGPFLRFRRFNYYTARTVEIPDRLLHRWTASRQRMGYLTLDDMAEIAARRNAALEPPDYEQALSLYYPLGEWPLVDSAAKGLTFYARLDPLQRRQAQSEAGLALTALTPDQMAALLHTFEPPGDPAPDPENDGRFWIRLREPGVYEWYDWTSVTLPKSDFPVRVAVHEATRAAAEEEVRALLRSRGASEAEIDREVATIRGPDSGILVRVQVGDRFFMEESSGHDDRQLRGIADP